MRKTLFIGGGNMAFAIIGGLLEQGASHAHLAVIDPSDAAAKKMQALGVGCTANWPSHFEADQIVLAVKPQMMQDVLKGYQANLKNVLIISIAAGVSIEQIRQWSQQTQAAVARTMPNTPALVGKGMTGICFTDNCSAEDRSETSSLFQSCGEVVELANEDDINAITAISGSGPGYVFYLMEALESAATELGFSNEQARLLVNQTFLGAASLASASADTLAVLREKVTSKGGTTFAGLETLRSNGVADAISKAALAAKKRAEELQKGS